MKQAFIKLHLSILLAGFTGVFGKIISLNEGLLVWYRMLFASILFFMILYFSGRYEKMPVRTFIRNAFAGVILSTHWILFYASIKQSNVSIGVLCFSLTGFFTAIFEPLIYRRRLSLRELLYSFITVAGIAMIFSFDPRYRLGIMLGVVSSAVDALFTVYNKKISAGHSSGTVFLNEMAGGLVYVTLLMPLYLYLFPVASVLPSATDLVCLLFFAVFCTIVMYILQIQALKQISAFTVNLSYNLEPIYSIIIAMLFLGEAKQLNYSFYIGLVLIMTSVLLQMRSVIVQQRVQRAG